MLGTVKEIPANAEAISHKLMLCTGLIRRVATGIYALEHDTKRLQCDYDPNALREHAHRHNLLLGEPTPANTLRLVTHKQINAKDIAKASQIIAGFFC